MLVALLVIWIVAIPAVIVAICAGCAWRRERPDKRIVARGRPVASELAGLTGVGSAQHTR